jgi:CDP-diacylglycerol--glycerol-3-phosphate 3-phosphatidyltransferase
MSLSIYQLKPRFQQLLRPLLDGLLRLGVTPNQVTLFAMLLSIAYGLALAFNPTATLLWAGFPLLMLVRMALNAIDGMLATASGQASRLGALLNEMGDQVSDVALYLPFALAPSVTPSLCVAVVIAALLAEFAGVLGCLLGVARRFDGPMGKSDRAFGFSVAAIMIALGTPAGGPNGALAAMLLLSAWTVFNRLRQALLASAPPTR